MRYTHHAPRSTSGTLRTGNGLLCCSRRRVQNGLRGHRLPSIEKVATSSGTSRPVGRSANAVRLGLFLPYTEDSLKQRFAILLACVLCAWVTRYLAFDHHGVREVSLASLVCGILDGMCSSSRGRGKLFHILLI
jgi:hypothetical protein